MFFFFLFLLLLIIISCQKKNYYTTSNYSISCNYLWWFFIFFILFFFIFIFIAAWCINEEEKINDKKNKCSKELSRRKECYYNSIFREEDPNKVKVGFWSSDVVDQETRRVPLDYPDAIIEFSWEDSKRCFTWNRTVSESQGSGTRLNVATNFKLTKEKCPGKQSVYIFSFVQNSSRCCSEFSGKGTKKTFRSDVVTVDESTSQQGFPEWGAVIEAEGIIEVTDGKNTKIIKI